MPTWSPRRTRAPNTRGCEMAKPAERWSSSATASPRMRLDKDVLATALDDDFFCVLQSADHVDDALLRLFNLPQADRTADLHLLFERLRRTRGLVAADPLLQFFARTAHRQ